MSVKKWNFSKLILASVCILTLLLGWLVFGERGLLHLYRAELERQEYIEKIRQLSKQNQIMLDEIENLRNNMEYIEHLARTELNMVKKNEIIYKFEKQSDQSSTAPTENLQDIDGVKIDADSKLP
ncbi:MAG: septum formation initiator family protein [Desulfatiglandaceae bacterium]